jgi:hypothetical protein
VLGIMSALTIVGVMSWKKSPRPVRRF